jgi:hypothetical protein
VCVLACATAQGGVTRSHWLRTDMSRSQLLPQKVEDEWSGAGSLSTAQRLNAAFEEVVVSAFPDLPSGKGALLARCSLFFLGFNSWMPYHFPLVLAAASAQIWHYFCPPPSQGWCRTVDRGIAFEKTIFCGIYYGALLVTLYLRGHIPTWPIHQHPEIHLVN